MPRLALQTNRRPPKKFLVTALITSFAVLATLPGTPVLESPLFGQWTESFLPSRFSSHPVIESRYPSGVRLSKGKFLVASRQLKDPNFTETVVLLVEYDRSGAMGLVVNRPTEIRLSTVLPDMEGLQDMPDTVYVGGPVAKHQMLLLIRSSSQPDDARRVFDDIYLSSSRALLRKIVDDKDPGQTFRLYAGHAGWAPGQLDQELARGGWHVLQADGATVFEKAPSEIWPELIQRSSALWVRLQWGTGQEPNSRCAVNRSLRVQAIRNTILGKPYSTSELLSVVGEALAGKYHFGAVNPTGEPPHSLIAGNEAL